MAFTVVADIEESRLEKTVRSLIDRVFPASTFQAYAQKAESAIPNASLRDPVRENAFGTALPASVPSFYKVVDK